MGEDLNPGQRRREERCGFEQEQIGGARAEAAGDPEDAEGRAHFQMIAGAAI
jgi:hypothetical protein